MSLVTKEISITSTTPVKILTSTLTQRQVFLTTTAGMYIGGTNAGSPDGFHLPAGGDLTFALASGDEIWAWGDTGSSGTVQLLATTALLA